RQNGPQNGNELGGGNVFYRYDLGHELRIRIALLPGDYRKRRLARVGIGQDFHVATGFDRDVTVHGEDGQQVVVTDIGRFLADDDNGAAHAWIEHELLAGFLRHGGDDAVYGNSILGM